MPVSTSWWAVGPRLASCAPRESTNRFVTLLPWIACTFCLETPVVTSWWAAEPRLASCAPKDPVGGLVTSLPRMPCTCCLETPVVTSCWAAGPRLASCAPSWTRKFGCIKGVPSFHSSPVVVSLLLTVAGVLVARSERSCFLISSGTALMSKISLSSFGALNTPGVEKLSRSSAPGWIGWSKREVLSSSAFFPEVAFSMFPWSWDEFPCFSGVLHASFSSLSCSVVGWSVPWEKVFPAATNSSGWLNLVVVLCGVEVVASFSMSSVALKRWGSIFSGFGSPVGGSSGWACILVSVHSE